MLGRAFKSGNSLAVRIPRELGLIEQAGDVDIQRVGDALVIRPCGMVSLAGLQGKLAAFPADFMAAGREPNDERDRAW